MDNLFVKKKSWIKANLEWLLQLIASLSWMISVFVYGTYELGDYLQLLASSSWTASNIMIYFSRLD
tara:strand:+ start:1312 stop:1509 length:198 start_codon:yes stop_codon:yes gene_type:complete